MDGSVRLARRALRRAFPQVGFALAIDENDLRITWTDGPTQADVDKVANLYAGQDFGNICSEDVEHWLTDDGVSIRAKGPDLFVLPAGLVPPGSRRVRFALQRVWVDRQLSNDFRDELAALLSELTGEPFDPTSEQIREFPFLGALLRGPGLKLIWQASCYIPREIERKS